ncbi:MAG TPA: hypothetical protein VN256_11465 [Pyrinomonadaceae bacterium]|nr:hypothetical protein [Pyrinomonadaceae bacterium]
MAVQIIVSQAGSLPIKVSFSAVTDGPATLEVSGSIWSEYPNLMVGIGVFIDNEQLGAAQIFANTAAMHLAVVPAYFPVQLTPGEHTVYLSRISGESMGDQNDFYNVVLHY